MASSLDDSSDPSLSFTSDRLNLTISLPGLASKEGTYTLTAVNGDGTDSGEIVLDIKSECFTQIMIMLMCVVGFKGMLFMLKMS